MLLEESHCLFAQSFIRVARLRREELIRLFLEEKQVAGLLLAAAELVEEIVDFSTSFFLPVVNFLDV